MAENKGGEFSVGVEKESGPVRRVAKRVGEFLSETYTVKGAFAKEMQKIDKVYRSFTLEQQQEMRAYFAAKAEKSAKWKVIRNWVATGAGIALGAVLLVKPTIITEAVLTAGKIVSGWWETATAAISKIASGSATGAVVPAAEKVGVTAEGIKYGLRDWIFDLSKGQKVVDVNLGYGKALGDAGDWISGKWQGVATGIQPLWQSMSEGLNFRLPPKVNITW